MRECLFRRCFDELLVHKDVLLTHSRQLCDWFAIVTRPWLSDWIIHYHLACQRERERENVPILPSIFTFLHHCPCRLYSLAFSLIEKRIIVWCFTKNYCFSLLSLKAPKCEKRKRADRIDPIARNKGCHTAVTERPSSRHYFLRITPQSILLLHEYFWSSTCILDHLFDIYSLFQSSFHKSILYPAPFIYYY